MVGVNLAFCSKNINKRVMPGVEPIILLGYPHISGGSLQFDYEERADRLQKLLQGYNFEVILVLRYQTDWLYSAYRFHPSWRCKKSAT